MRLPGRHGLIVILPLAAACGLLSCGKDPDMEFSRFVQEHTSRVEAIETEGNLAYWAAARSGSEEDFSTFTRAQMRLESIYTDREDFEYIKKVRDSGALRDGHLKRLAEILYLRYLRNQLDPKLLEKRVMIGSKIEQEFGTYRPVVDGVAMTSNDIRKILRTSTDQEERRKAWEASKAVGAKLESDLISLVKLRNKSAQAVGFGDYYEMSLTLGEQDMEYLVGVFAELEEVSREPFIRMKAALDEGIMERFGITADEIMPWHYNDPFFQESPSTGEVDLDRFYEGKDVAQIAADFFASVGMPVEDILSRSDLYEREGKNPHAFTMDVDRKGDIRILANIADNSMWMETMLHELGHGIYDKYVDGELPYMLRTYPHLCTTEASSMFFGRLARDPQWIKNALGLDDATIESITPALRRSLRLRELVFARWVQVMFNFEKELYANPEQDLNALWWQLKEKYQFIRKPEGRDEPDYAAKIHIISSPVYYHNYMIGELIASQFLHHLGEISTSEGEPAIYGNKAVGEYFRETVFKPGNSWIWTEHIERVTGEPLTARYFAGQFAEEAD